jgi:signal transduction histidine kinase
MSSEERILALEKIIEEQKIAISQISHEVRNPVTLINSSLKLIEQQHPEVMSFDFWQDTRNDCDYLLRLLNEVSCYNNSMTLREEKLNTSLWLTEFAIARKARTMAPFRFLYEIPKSLPSLAADPVKLRQALENLIRNAFESLEQEGTVSLRAFLSDQGDALCITVSDNGCGIPAEYMDTLFEPFATHKQDGTGLGLAITHRIVEAHGGQLLVDTTPGEGTRFTMKIPFFAS